jgi:type VI secretion system protein VasJ
MAPIPGDNPFGDNVNYDTDFEFVKSEIGKLGGVDWEAIESASRTILKEKSKDVRVFAFLSFVYLRDENWEAFADVFDGLSQLAGKDYDNLFPDRPRARQMAFKWLSEARYNDTLEEKKPVQSDHEHIERLAEKLAALKQLLEEKFPDASPFPSRILSAAQKWRKSTEPKAAPQAASANVTAASSASAPSPAGGAAVGQMDTPKQAQTEGRKIAQFLIEQEPKKPMGYRLLRSLRWDLLEKAPPANGSQTQLPPPQPAQRTYFQNLVGKADWATALPAAEKAFSGGANHFWLDLQRIAATAAKQLGGEYRSVHEIICLETALLLKRIPGLTELSYSDGSSFCDAATRDWISDEAAGMLGSGDSGAASRKGGSVDAVEEEKKLANGLIASGKIDQALDLLQQSINASGSQRDNFRRKVFLSSLLFSAKRFDIACAILESLDETIQMYGLEKWDAALAVEAWEQQVKTYKALSANKPPNIQQPLLERLNSILQKLSRTDPKAAFKITV